MAQRQVTGRQGRGPLMGPGGDLAGTYYGTTLLLLFWGVGTGFLGFFGLGWDLRRGQRRVVRARRVSGQGEETKARRGVTRFGVGPGSGLRYGPRRGCMVR